MKLKITNLGHSCILVETEDRVALFDPGIWSEAFDVNKIDRLDRLVITHEHPDHMDVVKMNELTSKFNKTGLKVVCNESVQKSLENQGIETDFYRETNCTKPFVSPHDTALPFIGAQVPDNTGFHFKDIFTHPGDNNSPTESKAILAMPFIAPWGKPRDGLDTVVRLAPKYVISIHDWHLSAEGRKWYNDVFTSTLKDQGVEYLAIRLGETVELEA